MKHNDITELQAVIVNLRKSVAESIEVIQAAEKVIANDLVRTCEQKLDQMSFHELKSYRRKLVEAYQAVKFNFDEIERAKIRDIEGQINSRIIKHEKTYPPKTTEEIEESRKERLSMMHGMYY